MIHAHITAWFLTLVLFVIALILNKNGNAKGYKVTHMILRVFYLLIIATGIMLLFSVYHISFLYILKAAVGLWIIALFEIILIRTANKRRTTIIWFQFVVVFLLVLYLGFRLPLGTQIF